MKKLCKFIHLSFRTHVFLYFFVVVYGLYLFPWLLFCAVQSLFITLYFDVFNINYGTCINILYIELIIHIVKMKNPQVVIMTFFKVNPIRPSISCSCSVFYYLKLFMVVLWHECVVVFGAKIQSRWGFFLYERQSHKTLYWNTTFLDLVNFLIQCQNCCGHVVIFDTDFFSQ